MEDEESVQVLEDTTPRPSEHPKLRLHKARRVSKSLKETEREIFHFARPGSWRIVQEAVYTA